MKEKLRKFSRRLFLPVFLILATFVFSPPAVFSNSPPATAHWEMVSPSQFHLGEVIRATIVITTVSGASLDISRLPDVGGVIELPSKIPEPSPGDWVYYDIPPTIPEGELEVVSRRITRHLQDGQVVTEVSYELIYLLGIDPTTPADDKRLPFFMTISQEYRIWYGGRPRHIASPITVDTVDFLIVPRIVDDGSEPIFRFVTFVPSSFPWQYLRLAGFVSLGLAVCLIVRRALILIPKRRSSQTLSIDRPPAAQELFELWCEKPETLAFIEAVKFYRRGVWGRPKASLWITTTFILYSGVALDLEQTKSIFARLVKEVSDV